MFPPPAFSFSQSEIPSGEAMQWFGQLATSANMESDFMKRGYLLPKGCKDLIHGLKFKSKPRAADCEGSIDFAKLTPKVWRLKSKQQLEEHPVQLPPTLGEIVVPKKTTVSQLATLLDQKPFRIIADLMQIGVFARVNQLLGFKAICRIARKYGYLVRKAA